MFDLEFEEVVGQSIHVHQDGLCILTDGGTWEINTSFTVVAKGYPGHLVVGDPRSMPYTVKKLALAIRRVLDYELSGRKLLYDSVGNLPWSK